MTMKRNNGGFTLVELIVTIAIGSLITIAATTSLLLGMRINAKSTETIQAQNATNTLVQVLENVVEQKDITVPDPHHIKQETDDAEPKTYVEYNETEQNLYLNGTVFMEEVTSFEAVLSDDQLLTIKLTTNDEEYTASIYCRLNPTPEPSPTAVPSPEPSPTAGGDA